MLAMISCRQASELMSQQLDRKLRLGEMLRLRAHLMICKTCPKTLQQFKILREAGKCFANKAQQEQRLSAQSRERILNKLREQRVQSKDKK